LEADDSSENPFPSPVDSIPICSNPKDTVPILIDSSYDDLIFKQAILFADVIEYAVLESDQTFAHCAKPENAMPILVYGDDGRPRKIADDGEFIILELCQSLIRPDPHKPAAILKYRQDIVIRQAVFGRERSKLAIFIPIEPAPNRADPKRSFMIAKPSLVV
jgi:hypothetical protein